MPNQQVSFSRVVAPSTKSLEPAKTNPRPRQCGTPVAAVKQISELDGRCRAIAREALLPALVAPGPAAPPAAGVSAVGSVNWPELLIEQEVTANTERGEVWPFELLCSLCDLLFKSDLVAAAGRAVLSV